MEISFRLKSNVHGLQRIPPLQARESRKIRIARTQFRAVFERHRGEVSVACQVPRRPEWFEYPFQSHEVIRPRIDNRHVWMVQPTMNHVEGFVRCQRIPEQTGPR